LGKLFQAHRLDRVCYLAAKAGVRYSLQAPHKGNDSNVAGFKNIVAELIVRTGLPVEHRALLDEN
jgi:nucleoside-diphosphate-sugar epimerase